MAMAFERLADADIRADEIAQMLAQAYVVAGAHRAPDRGAAQEHPRRRARDRRAGRAARRSAHRARASRQRGAAERARDAAVADADVAHRQADGGRRDRERADVLPVHLPAPVAAPVPRPRAGPAGARGGAVPAHGAVDRRRPRRQSERRRADLEARVRAPGRGGAALLPHRGARTRRPTVDLADPGAGDAGDARAGQALARPQSAPRGRAVPPGA